DQVDLVLMDFHMPGMDGEETFRHLQEINPSLRCIFSSGFGPDKTRKRIGHLDGRIDYLQKPYDLPTLRNAIVGILD
ncbi:MAG: response regulator, partial [Chloroflexota bacterium]